MKKLTLIAAVVMTLVMTACTEPHRITITNDSAIDRVDEMVELDFATADSMMNHQAFHIIDRQGNEVPYQVTHDGKLIFRATVKAGSKARYTLLEGAPAAVDTLACGRFYQRRKDDFTWENDRSAYRAYGPALQAGGEQAYGYDIWTKSVPHPVVAQRYADAFAEIKNLHKDYGEGMDVYSVGPTLGGGTAALIDSTGAIVYPRSFTSYEILDNGPLRFTVKLQYGSDLDPKIVETRIISLDAGEYLNRTTVSFAGLPREMTFAPGLVVHAQNPEGYSLVQQHGVMAYADLTDDVLAGNGIIYLGIVAPEADSLCVDELDPKRGDAIAHLLAKSKLTPADSYTYYWGSGWSKGSMPDWKTWKDYLTTFRARLDQPLKIEIK